MHIRVAQLLTEHDLRQTASREEILHEFCEAESALSQPDLEKKFGAQFDRVTIYRTLSSFLEKGILHKVLDDTGAMKYALCPEACDDEGHDHDHVHFKCNQCGKTSCIEKVEIPSISLPKGYQLSEANLLLSGICPTCSR